MRPDVFTALSRSRRTNPEVQDTAMRQNIRPAVADAQDAADQAKGLPPVGASMRWWGEEDPAGGLLMIEDGRQLPINDYLDLFMILGVRHNKAADPEGTFRLPDSRDRIGMGASSTNAVGSRRGQESTILVVNQMPSHAHLVTIATDTHNHGGSTNSGGAHGHAGDTGSAGAHNHSFTGHQDLVGQVPGGGTREGFMNGTLGKTVSNEPGHTHSITAAADHDHGIPNSAHNHSASCANAGSASPSGVPTLPPVIHCNYVIRVKP